MSDGVAPLAARSSIARISSIVRTGIGLTA
jgi:hypothetical protein